jgi:hypothetical protein
MSGDNGEGYARTPIMARSAKRLRTTGVFTPQHGLPGSARKSRYGKSAPPNSHNVARSFLPEEEVLLPQVIAGIYCA